MLQGRPALPCGPGPGPAAPVPAASPGLVAAAPFPRPPGALWLCRAGRGSRAHR